MKIRNGTSLQSGRIPHNTKCWGHTMWKGYCVSVPCLCGFLRATAWPLCEKRRFDGPSLVWSRRADFMFLWAMIVRNGTSMFRGSVLCRSRCQAHTMGEVYCLHTPLVWLPRSIWVATVWNGAGVHGPTLISSGRAFHMVTQTNAHPLFLCISAAEQAPTANFLFRQLATIITWLF